MPLFRALRSRLLVSFCAPLLLCCGSSSGDSQSRDDASNPALRADATLGDATAATNGDAALDGSLPPDDAQSQAADAALLDGAGAALDGSALDAQVDAGPRPQRAQSCGDRSSWPAPLPADEKARVAQPVGTRTFTFIEGPVWIAEQGVLLFSEMDVSDGNPNGPAARIYRLRPPATFELFVQGSNSNGLALSADGLLYGATHDIQGLSRFSLQTAQRTQLALRSDGKRLNSPNDLAIRSDGTVYLTDPDWQIGKRPSETEITGVYRATQPLQSSGTNSVQIVDKTLFRPNGIALSPDERTLYVGSSNPEIWKYDVATNGTISNRQLFAETGGSDGLTVDCAGNLYVTTQTVKVLSPAGQPLGEITLAEGPTNVAFGGADRKTLYITANTRLYSIALAVPGFPY